MDEFAWKWSQLGMDEHEEEIYIRGRNAAFRLMLQECIRGLGVEGNAESWRVERGAVVAQLRELCAEFGDNDWTDDSHLADVIEKHLGNYLWAAQLVIDSSK